MQAGSFDMTKEERREYFRDYYQRNKKRLQDWQRVYQKKYYHDKKKGKSSTRRSFTVEREANKTSFTKRDLQAMSPEKFLRVATRIAINDAQLV